VLSCILMKGFTLNNCLFGQQLERSLLYRNIFFFSEKEAYFPQLDLYIFYIEMKNIPTTCGYPLYFIQYTSDCIRVLSGLMLWLKQNFATLDLPNVSSPGTRAGSPVVILVARLA
jgi:hypothetical protein